jgi:glycosyltransferase involved in cell wall biosynthesis
MSCSISVIIPAYQHALTLPACLNALLAQTAPADEIIVVDDGSTDNTPDLLADFEKRGVRVIRQENAGSNEARNRGFQEATGELLLFLDADVVMRRAMLERLEQALHKNPTAAYAYCRFRFGWKRFASYPFSKERLCAMNYIHTTSLIRREWFPGFDSRIKRFQDWDVWLTILEKGGEGVFVPEELFQVCVKRGRTGISSWRPSWLYKIPWKRFRWAPSSVDKYEEARRKIFEKHGLCKT